MFWFRSTPRHRFFNFCLRYFKVQLRESFGISEVFECIPMQARFLPLYQEISQLDYSLSTHC